MKDVTVKECRSGADIVPYMYGELSDAKGAAFESHLLECTACVDEFASLSLARYEVYDWKQLEFDGIPTPDFSVPFEKQTIAGAPSWIERVRGAFSTGWAIPAAAFAGLTVVSILAWILIYSVDRAPEIAANEGPNNTVAENRIGETVPDIARPLIPNGGPILTHREEASQTAPKVARSSGRTVVPQNATARNVKSSARSLDFKQASARNNVKTVPRLNDFNEDEDTSLRLAELFDDGDTRN